MNYILAKVFNNVSYASDFLAGKLYRFPLTSFGIGNLYQPRKDMTNKYRGEMNEGLGSNIPFKNTLPSDSVYNFY